MGFSKIFKMFVLLWLCAAMGQGQAASAAFAAPPSPLPELQISPDASEYVKKINYAYEELRVHFSQGANNYSSFMQSLNLFSDLNASIYPDLVDYSPNTSADNLLFLDDLFEIFSELYYQASNVFAKTPFDTITESIRKCYPLFKMQKYINNNNGWTGNSVWNNIPDPQHDQLFQNTIKALLGRIFVVNFVTKKIIFTATGMILPQNIDGNIYYDKVVTCAHNMEATNHSPDLRFYFVRAAALDDTLGMPTEVADKNEPEVIAFLEEKSVLSNDVRRILRFDLSAEHSITSYLHCHSPLYQPHQDCGFAHLEKSFDFSGMALATVTLATSRTRIADYYAIGYPILRNMDDVIERAPVFMTKSRNAMILKNGLMIHGAVTAQGQSGGPILKFETDSIEILGIIAKGDMDNNYMCKYW